MRRARWTRGELKPSEEPGGKAKRGGGSDKALHLNIVSFICIREAFKNVLADFVR